MKSKVLLGVLLFCVVLSVSSLFYKTVILQDFTVIEPEEEEVLDEDVPAEDTGEIQNSSNEADMIEEPEIQNFSDESTKNIE